MIVVSQGSPLSMTYIAFLLRPWILLVFSKGGRPRTLVDDILIRAASIGHARRLRPLLRPQKASSFHMRSHSQVDGEETLVDDQCAD